MGIRVLLGALAVGLVLFGSGGAHANKADIPGVAEAAADMLSDVREIAISPQSVDDHKPTGWDQAFGGAEHPDSEEVCTILMVLRGQGLAAPPVSAGRHANGPHISEKPAVPPPEPWASNVKTSAKNISKGFGALEARTDQIRKPNGCGPLPTKTTSLWDLGDDPRSMLLAPCESGNPDSEVCTVLMVWRGEKRAIVKATRLPRQAPFPSIVPPVPPPQRDATTTAYFAFACAPDSGRKAVRDTRVLDARSAKYSTSTIYSSLGSLRPHLASWGGCALRSRGAAWEAGTERHEITNIKKVLSKGSKSWGTS